MQRLPTSLDIKQFCAGSKAVIAVIYTRLGQEVYGKSSRFFEDKNNSANKKNSTTEKKVLNRLRRKSIFDILYNQFCHLSNKIKNILVNKRRLTDLLDQNVSNTASIGNCRQLMACYTSYVGELLSYLVCNRLRSNAGSLFSNTWVFEVIKASSVLKTEERGIAMA